MPIQSGKISLSRNLLFNFDGNISRQFGSDDMQPHQSGLKFQHRA
jgi:hypothetical protein